MGWKAHATSITDFTSSCTLDRALRGSPVIIRKGNRLVQLTEFVVPEPIPERPVGYFQRRPADYALANGAVADVVPVR